MMKAIMTLYRPSSAAADVWMCAQPWRATDRGSVAIDRRTGEHARPTRQHAGRFTSVLCPSLGADEPVMRQADVKLTPRLFTPPNARRTSTSSARAFPTLGSCGLHGDGFDRLIGCIPPARKENDTRMR